MTQRTGTNVKNVGDVATLVNAGFYECEVSLPTPVPPEDKGKERKNDDGEKNANGNASNSTVGNSGVRGWTVK